MYNRNIWCFCIILKSAITHNNLLVIFTFPNSTLEVHNLDNVSQELIVSHYDCTKMQDNRMYSLNKVNDERFHLKICISVRLPLLSTRNIAPTCQEQCVLSRSMLSDTIVECSLVRHTCMTKIASLMT